MKITIIHKLLLLILLYPSTLFAQDITGLWKGEMYVDSTKKTLPYEISISQVKNKLVGYSLITFEEDGKLETGTRDIKIERQSDKIIIEDISLLDNSFKVIPPKNIKKKMELTLSIQDDEMTLAGNWSTNKTKQYSPATGTVKLHRKTDFKASGLYKKLNSLGLADQLIFKEHVPTNVHGILKIDSNNIAKQPEKLTNPDEAKVVSVNDADKINVSAINKFKDQKIVVETTTLPSKNNQPQPATTVNKAKTTEYIPSLKIGNDSNYKNIENDRSIQINKKVAAVIKPVQVVVNKDTSFHKTDLKVLKNPLINAAPLPDYKNGNPKEIAVAAMDTKPLALPLPGLQQGAADINKRSIASTQSVYFQSDSLVLTLYDNGYVDGDTVSVVMNGSVIFSKQGLSTRPVNKTIFIDAATPDSILLVMYAENLGSIPPNTGLLVVHDGEAVYDVRFSADLSTNAAIILKRKKLIK